MCGNIGLLKLSASTAVASSAEFKKRRKQPDELDRSLHRSLHEVSKLHGLRVKGGSNWTHNVSYDGRYDVVEVPRSLAMLPLFNVLQAQVASTEVRGGQAGGISCLSFHQNVESIKSTFDAQFGGQSEVSMVNTRVRCVARKRFPLASDLISLFKEKQTIKTKENCTATFVGHTRFATSSKNMVPELHPHEWVPFHDESAWMFNSHTGRFERFTINVGLHLSHNGDFDALEAYDQTVVVGDVGLWLERVLHVPNDTKGDSPKLAGCMDLFRVQGRWAAAARLAYLRCILKSVRDVTGGETLSKSAPNLFPNPSVWELWSSLFDSAWTAHIGNVIRPVQRYSGHFYYYIDASGEAQFLDFLKTEIEAKVRDMDGFSQAHLNQAQDWTSSELKGFLYHTVRGFLRADMYSALSEIISKAEGSFGVQVHCSMEPGVMVIASKGQPMSMAFDPKRSMCLFGSEAEAVAVPVDQAGQWLSHRLDLDSAGEVQLSVCLNIKALLVFPAAFYA